MELGLLLLVGLVDEVAPGLFFGRLVLLNHFLGELLLLAIDLLLLFSLIGLRSLELLQAQAVQGHDVAWGVPDGLIGKAVDCLLLRRAQTKDGL